MRIVIQDDRGKDLQISSIPEGEISDEQAQMMGLNLVSDIKKLRTKLDNWEKKSFETCNCFAKKHAKNGRLPNGTHHSSECAIWSV